MGKRIMSDSCEETDGTRLERGIQLRGRTHGRTNIVKSSQGYSYYKKSHARGEKETQGKPGVRVHRRRGSKSGGHRGPHK